MFELISLNHQQASYRLSDYLALQGIPNKVEGLAASAPIDLASANQAQGYRILLVNEADLFKAKEIAHEFIQSPNQDKFKQASWQNSEVKTGSSNIDFSGLKSVLSRFRGFTLSIAILLIFMHVLVLSGLAPRFVHSLYFPRLFSSLDWADVYRIWSPALLHGDWFHLAFNAMAWLWLGNLIESKEGKARLVLVCLITGAIAHFSQYWMVNANFIGISGIVYGLLAYVWVSGHNRKVSEYLLPNNIVVFSIIWIVLGFADILWLNMANWAHLGGFIGGGLCAALFYVKQKSR